MNRMPQLYWSNTVAVSANAVVQLLCISYGSYDSVIVWMTVESCSIMSKAASVAASHSLHNTSSRCKTRATWIHVSAAHWRSCGKRGNKGYWSMWWVWCSEKEIYPWDSKVQVLIFSCNCIWLCCFQSWEKSTAPHPSISCRCWRVTVANRQTVWTAWRSPGRYNMWQ